MKILIFAASHRIESYNRKLAVHTADYMRGKGVAVDFAEYAEFDMPMYNDAIDPPSIATIFGKRAAQADGIVIASPEYNWSFPGSLKNIIDWTSRMSPNPVKGKTALLMSASTGARGGILGLNHLRSPLESSEIFIFPRVFPLGHCHQVFKGETLEGKFAAPLQTIIDDYLQFTGKLSTT